MLMGTDRKRRLLPVTIRPGVNIAFQSGGRGVKVTVSFGVAIICLGKLF